MKTIKTEQYTLVAGIKVMKDGYFWANDGLRKCIDLKEGTNHPYFDGAQWHSKHWESYGIVGHLPLGSSAKLEGVPLLMGEPGGLETEEAHKIYPYLKTPVPGFMQDMNFEVRKGLVEGYKMAREKYSFTREQMREAIEMSHQRVKSGEQQTSTSCYCSTTEAKYTVDQIIDLLTPEWEYEVEMEYDKKEEWGESFKPKTTIIDNETYLVGKWKEVKK